MRRQKAWLLDHEHGAQHDVGIGLSLIIKMDVTKYTAYIDLLILIKKCLVAPYRLRCLQSV